METSADLNSLYVNYIKAIENPDKVGWDGTRWVSPTLKGYDKNNRGYGVDIEKNDSAKRLTEGRPGRWLSDSEMNNLMKEHISYVENVAKKRITNFDKFSPKKKAAIIGMLYRGDSVNQAAKNGHINLNEKDDNLFLDSISRFYKTKGLHERAKNSTNFFGLKDLNLKTPKNFNLEKIVIPVDKTRVSRLEYIPPTKLQKAPKPIPWGSVDPKTFGGRSSFMKKGNKFKLISKTWKN